MKTVLVGYNDSTLIGTIERDYLLTISKRLPFNGLLVSGPEKAIDMLRNSAKVDSVEERKTITLANNGKDKVRSS